MNIVGIDISNETFDCCFIVDNKPHYNTFSQDTNGYFSFLSTFKMLNIDTVGFESTGVYHKAFQKYLIDNGVTPIVLSPRSVSLFIKSTTNNKGKTDKTDSYFIALYIMKNSDLVALYFPIRDEFKPLTTTLIQYEKQIRQLKNLYHSISKVGDDFVLLASVDSMIKNAIVFRDELKIHAVSKLYSSIPEALLIKSEIKGVGDMVLLSLLPLIYDHFDKFTIKQIVSFIGISPVPFQSGTSVKKFSHISHRGDANTRKILFMSAISSVRTNPIMKEKFLRMVADGKPKKVVLIAVMAHLLRAIVSRLSHHTGRPIKK
ncbi:MAG: transposase [Gallionella sp.]|jgi:transposase|nr:transposase [Gallionella sp.]